MVCKIKNEEGSFAIEQPVGLKSKMFFFLVVDKRQHEKANSANKNVVETVNYSECKDVLLI